MHCSSFVLEYIRAYAFFGNFTLYGAAYFKHALTSGPTEAEHVLEKPTKSLIIEFEVYLQSS